MKKLALSLILGTSLIITPSAFALNAMTDSNMKAATGQAGVSIALDDITIFQSIGSTTYTDTDGISYVDDSAAGSVVISGKETLTTYRAILDNTDRNGFLDRDYDEYLTRDTANGGDIHISPVTIDVTNRVQSLSAGLFYNMTGIAAADQLDETTYVANAESAALALAQANDALDAINLIITTNNTIITEGEGGANSYTAADITAAELAVNTAELLVDDADSLVNTTRSTATSAGTLSATYAGTKVAGVVIGLPTLEICKTGDTQTTRIAGSGSINNGKAFIRTTRSDSVMAILGGTIEICAH